MALSAPLTVSLVQPVISSVVKVLSGREASREGRGYFLTLIWVGDVMLHTCSFSYNNSKTVKGVTLAFSTIQ